MQTAQLYVRCKIKPGMFKDEVLVKVGPDNEWVYVLKTDIVKLIDGEFGVKVEKDGNLKISLTEDGIWVLVKDKRMNLQRRRFVPEMEILKEYDIKKEEVKSN